MRISRHGRAAALAALAYTVLALAYTWPLPIRLGTGVTHDLGDPLLNTWILWWSGTHVPLTAPWWNAAAFYPAPGILAFSEHLLGLVPIGATVPVHRVVAARLPHNYFVYFFVTLLAGSVLALVLAARTPLGLLWASDAIPLPQVGDENLLLLPMMALAEAFMNVRGPAVAVVYSPQWVARCDARLDLRRR